MDIEQSAYIYLYIQICNNTTVYAINTSLQLLVDDSAGCEREGTLKQTKCDQTLVGNSINSANGKLTCGKEWQNKVRHNLRFRRPTNYPTQ